MQCIKMHLKMHVMILLCSISVIYADRSIDLAKCQRFDDGDNNCERFSFQKISQNFTIALANNSIGRKTDVASEAIKSVDAIENRLVFKKSAIQEDGNYGVSSFIAPME